MSLSLLTVKGWHNAENPGPEYGYTLYKRGAIPLNINADRWNCRGNVVFFWEKNVETYSLAASEVDWVRRNW